MELGKLAPAALQRWILSHLGAARDDVHTGPAVGSDAALVRLGAGRVLAITTDPLSIIPALGLERSAWLAAHLVASDLVTTGVEPAWASVTLNLPPQLSDADLERYARALSDAWSELGVAVVTGHTGRYAGCALPIVGACTLLGAGDEQRTVGPARVRAGDRVVITKGCAIETSVVTAWLAPERLAARIGAPAVARLRERWKDVSVVRDGRVALGAGGAEPAVSLLHDATEGGVLGGLVEVARACRHDLVVDRAAIPLTPEARAACEVLDVDPWWTLSEGTLIATAPPRHAAAVLEALATANIVVADVGAVVAGEGVLRLREPDGRERTIAEPEPDPYWAAYDRAVREGWR
jgi:hydrogenase expression/formation protein HypE